MTDKEMRRMSRGELLELLVAQMEENQILSRQLEEAREQLEDRRIRIENSGSLAEAALALNRVFETTELAVQQYSENLNAKAREEAAAIVEQAREEAKDIVAQAREYSVRTRKAAEKYWKTKRSRADRMVGITTEEVTPDDEAKKQNAGADAGA